MSSYDYPPKQAPSFGASTKYVPMTIPPTNQIRDALVSDANHIDNDKWRASNRMAFDQLSSLVAECVRLQTDNQQAWKLVELAKTMSDAIKEYRHSDQYQGVGDDISFALTDAQIAFDLAISDSNQPTNGQEQEGK